ncbi:MAG: amidohydrolase [Pseudomonadota bacterium]|nr:amidohydrolase [Pseudomonadota bacterium]
MRFTVLTRIRPRLVLVLLLLIPQISISAERIVFEARKIITMDQSMPEARYIAVEDGRILGVGNSLAQLDAWLVNQNYRIDSQFSEKVLLPGLIDPHLHPLMAAVLLPTAFITPEDWTLPSGEFPGVTTPEDYRQRLRELISNNQSSDPFITWGYHQLWHGDLDRQLLDEIEPNRAVIVWHRSFHEIIMNTAAMRFLELDSESLFADIISAPGIDPSHADYSAGHLSETALGVGLARLQPVILAPDKLNAGMTIIQKMLRQNGVTTIADMATGLFASFNIEAALIKQTFDHQDSAVRVILVPNVKPMVEQMGSADAVMEFLNQMQSSQISNKVFLNNRVKLLADGAFFSQYMRMNPPGYTDGHEGKWLTEPAELESLARAFWNNGYHIHTHVNGDEGLDAVLNTLEKLLLEKPRPDHRFTLEHFGYSTIAQAQRLHTLGAQVSAQPNYVYVLSDNYAQNGLGYDRASQMVRLGTLERQGTVVALHSDLTMAPADPLFLAWIAANRLTMEGTIMGPSERLSLDKALRAITIEAAHVIGLEDEIGSISAGKKADFAVLEQDPYEVDVTSLKDIPIWGVVFEGIPYAANDRLIAQ